MITALIGFLGSSAGGAILGFVLDFFAEKRRAKAEESEQKHRQRLAELDAIGEYTKQLDQQNPGTLKRIVTKFELWGFKYEKARYKMFPTNVASPRAMAVATSLLLLVIAYVATMLLFATFPSVELWTMDPDPEPFKFLWGFVTIPRNNIFVLTTGGVAYLMAHPLVFIISIAITGTARKLAR